MAAIAWRHGTCAEAALCADTGSIAVVDPAADDQQAAEALADAIDAVADLNATAVQDIGMIRFDPVRHFQTLASRSP